MRIPLLITFSLTLLLRATHAQSIDQLKACDILTVDEMAELIGTTVDQLVKEDMSFIENDRRSICHYILKGEIGSINIRVGLQSAKAQERKALEWNYSRYLKEGEKNLATYEELANGDHQILYGVNVDRSGSNHVIRKRYGVLGEIKIEVLKGSTDESLQSRLKAIIDNIK